MAAKKKVKKKAPKKSATARKVCGVAIKHVKPQILGEYLKQVGLSTDGSVEDKVRRLAEWVKEKVPQKSMVDCSTCGGDSSEDFDVCPYCGDDGVEEIPPKEEPAAKAAVKVAKAEPPSKYSLKDLNDSVAEVTALKQSLMRDYHALGTKILEIYSKDLWKLRRDENGNIAYTNWKKFCEAELGLSGQHAYRLMDVANAFSEDDIKAVGTTKLGFVLQVEEGPMRDKLLQTAKDGASAGELRQQLQEARSGSGNAGEPPPAPKVKKGDVTIYQAMGRITLKLYARPKTKNELRRAKKVADDAWAEETTGNDVKIVYHLRKDHEGNLVLVVERRRA